MNKHTRLNGAASVALLGLALGLTACGGDGATSPTTITPAPPPTPPPAVTSVLIEGSFGGLKKNFAADLPFSTTATGTLEAHVDWTFAESRIILLLARGSCPFEKLQQADCDFVSISDTMEKPRVLRVPGAAAGPYVLWIVNAGPKTESVSFQILLTTGGGASSASSSIAIGGLAFDLTGIEQE